jgi:repressor of nif and glnA expression
LQKKIKLEWINKYGKFAVFCLKTIVCSGIYFFMSEKTEKKELAILRLLQKAGRPLASSRLMENLQAMGHEVSERTVRHYFLDLDRKGLTRNLGRKGRVITDAGLKELANARVFDKVGFLAAKIDQLTYRMSFDLYKKSGTVIINVSLLDIELLPQITPLVCQVYEAGYSMGTMMAIFVPGEQVGGITIPEGTVGLGTVCSITLNGLLLDHGIPTHSSFGGLLELRKREPTRFVEIIKYDGSSLDPLEVFIRSGMTDYAGAIATGNGRIGVGFREVPADSRDKVISLIQKLKDVGLGGFLMVGWPGQPLLEIPVIEGRVGAIVIGGLNPVAILEETGIKIKSRALAGMAEYERLFHYQEMTDRIKGYLG